MAELFPPTMDEQIAEAQREAAMRRKVYAKLIAGGNLSRETAERRIAAMDAIVSTLQTVKAQGWIR